MSFVSAEAPRTSGLPVETMTASGSKLRAHPKPALSLIGSKRQSRSRDSAAADLDAKALRDHAEEILRAVIEDIGTH